MNEITLLIIGIGIGYFWAMYRKDNLKFRVSPNVYFRISPEVMDAYLMGKQATELERQAAELRERSGEMIGKERIDVQTTIKAD